MEAFIKHIWLVDSHIILNFLQFILLCYVMICCILYILLILRIITPCNKHIPVGCKVLIVIAHPDDECLFFAPSVTELLRVLNAVHILCITSGDYYGKGALRKKEILESCRILGLPEENVEIFDDSSFPDHPHLPWDFEKLRQHLCVHIGRVQPDYADVQGEKSIPIYTETLPFRKCASIKEVHLISGPSYELIDQ